MHITFTVAIETALIRAALVVAPKKDPADQLNSVRIEPNGNGLNVVATDRARLIAAYTEIECEGMPGPVNVPRDIVSRALTGYRDPVMLLSCDDSGQWYLGGVAFISNGQQFPDWRRIVPDTRGLTESVAASYDPALFGDFAKVAKAVGCHPTGVVTHARGEATALVQFEGRGDIFGLIMPLRVPPRIHAIDEVCCNVLQRTHYKNKRAAA